MPEIEWGITVHRGAAFTLTARIRDGEFAGHSFTYVMDTGDRIRKIEHVEQIVHGIARLRMGDILKPGSLVEEAACLEFFNNKNLRISDERVR